MADTEREAWLEQRRSGVGASDSPNLVGVGFGTAIDVWMEKRGVAPEKTGGWLQRGLDLEPIVSRRYEEVMGTTLVQGGMVWADNGWQFATLDRTRADDGRVVELKTVAGFGDDWGPAGTDLIPAGYRVQLQKQMGVTKTESCDLIALDVVSWSARIYRVEIDRSFFDWLTGIEHEFMEEFVRPGVMPPPGWEAKNAGRALAVVNAGERAEIGEELAALLDRRERLVRVRKEAVARLDEIDAAVGATMGGAAAAEGLGWRVTRTIVAGYRVEAHDRAESVRTNIRRVK